VKEPCAHTPKNAQRRQAEPRQKNQVCIKLDAETIEKSLQCRIKSKPKAEYAKTNLEILSYRYNLPAGNVVPQPQASLSFTS
jgi:hypothetical protein